MIKKVLWLVLLLAVIGGGVGFYLWNKPVASVSGQKSVHAISAQELLTAFQTDATAANAQYLGKIITVSGEIQELVPGDEKRMQIVLGADGSMSSVSCVLEEDRDNFLKRGLKKGDQVALKGKCTGAMDDMLGLQVIVDPVVIIEN
jgi:hypothetical protein